MFMRNRKIVQDISWIGIISALYVVITIVFAPI